jgi:hypothetical protein
MNVHDFVSQALHTFPRSCFAQSCIALLRALRAFCCVHSEHHAARSNADRSQNMRYGSEGRKGGESEEAKGGSEEANGGESEEAKGGSEEANGGEPEEGGSEEAKGGESEEAKGGSEAVVPESREQVFLHMVRSMRVLFLELVENPASPRNSHR